MPQLALLALVTVDSPALRGPDPIRMANWRTSQELLVRLRDTLI